LPPLFVFLTRFPADLDDKPATLNDAGDKVITVHRRGCLRLPPISLPLVLSAAAAAAATDGGDDVSGTK